MSEEIKRYLIIDASNENETMMGIIAWTDHLAKKIDRRLAWLEELGEKDDDLHTMSFWSGGEMFEGVLEFVDEKEEEKFEEAGWIVRNEPPDEDLMRISSVGLCVSKSGYVWWEFVPKHGEPRPYESRCLYRQSSIDRVLFESE